MPCKRENLCQMSEAKPFCKGCKSRSVNEIEGFPTENEENNQYFIESIDSRMDSVQKPIIIVNLPEYHQDINKDSKQI